MPFNFFIVAIEFIEAIDTIEARFALSLTLRVEDRRHLGNENKLIFILHFTRFALSLTCGRRYSRSENCK